MKNATTDKPDNHQASKANTYQDDLPRLAFSMRETAAILGVNYITVHRLIKRGLLRSSSALRTKIISRAEIDRFLAKV